MEERLSQQRAPVFEALKRFQRMRVVPFDVPGHKRGKGTPELTAFLGEQCMSVDVNSMKPLNAVCHYWDQRFSKPSGFEPVRLRCCGGVFRRL